MKPDELKAKYAGIPDALKQLPQWCGGWLTNDTPPRKIPDTIQGIDIDDARNLHSFDDVCSKAWVNRYQGAGIILNGEGVCAIDLDHVLAPDGNIIQGGPHEEAVAAIVDKATAAGAYIEVSTSGTGLHIIGVGIDVPTKEGTWYLPGQPRTEANKRQIEVYGSRHFLYLTGNLWQGMTGKITDIAEVIDLALDTITELKAEKAAEKSANNPGIDGQALADLVKQHNLQDLCTVSSGGMVTASRELLARVKAMALHEVTANTSQATDDANLQNKIKRSKRKDLFISLMQGDLTRYGGDNSAADEALLSILTWYAAPAPDYANPDLQQVARIWKQSALYRPGGQRKHNEADYVARSIANAYALWLFNVRTGKQPQYNPAEYGKQHRAEQLQAILKHGGQLALSADKFERIREELFDTSKYSLTESGAAERAALTYKDAIRYDAYNKKWYVYTEATGVWSVVPLEVIKGAVGLLFKKIESNAQLKKLNGEEIETDTESTDKDDIYTQYVKFARKQCTARALKNIVELLQTYSQLQINPNNFDKDKWLLNTPAGELNLQTGQLGPHQRSSYCTRITNASLPAEYSKNSLFLKTVQEIIPDSKTRQYVQMFIGMGLCGDASEQKVLWVHGDGGCGKGTLFNAVQEMLGSYAVTLDKEILLTSRNDGGAGRPKPELLRLQGARLALAQETSRGRKLKTEELKNITGGDRVEARALYSNNTVEFTPQFTLIMCSNYAPDLYDVFDKGLKRRLRAIQFRQSFRVDGDFRRSDAMKNNPDCQADILLWAYEGCKLWQKRGCIDSGFDSKQYPPAPEVKQDTAQVYNDSDTIQWFIDNYCKQGTKEWVARAALWKRFQQETKEMAWSGGKKRFFEDMEKSGFEIKINQGNYYFIGLSLNAEEDDHVWRGDTNSQ